MRHSAPLGLCSRQCSTTQLCNHQPLTTVFQFTFCPSREKWQTVGRQPSRFVQRTAEPCMVGGCKQRGTLGTKPHGSGLSRGCQAKHVPLGTKVTRPPLEVASDMDAVLRQAIEYIRTPEAVELVSTVRDTDAKLRTTLLDDASPTFKNKRPVKDMLTGFRQTGELPRCGNYTKPATKSRATSGMRASERQCWAKNVLIASGLVEWFHSEELWTATRDQPPTIFPGTL